MKLIKPNALPTTLAGFSRASTATYIDDNGVLQTAPANVARYQGGQLLVEGGATNLLLQSDAFEQAVWAKAAVSVAPGVGPLLAGAPSDKLVETTATGVHLVRQDFSATSGAAYTFSVFLCAGERTKALVWFGSVSSGVVVDLVAGTASVVPGFLTPSSYAISAVSGGYAVSVTMVSTLTGLIGASVYVLATDFAGRSYTGDGASGIFVRAAQVVSGQPTSYIPTTTTAATRAADVITGSGLLHTTATDATAAWIAGTTYLAGVQVQYNRVIYQSLQTNNAGRQPDTNPAWWARLGPVNDWAMFDDQVSTQTVQAAGPLRVALQTGAMDALAVLGVEADRVRLVVQDGAGGPVVYDQTQGMAAEAVTSWFDYFFNDPTFRRTQALFSNIPPYGSSVATLTFSSGSPVKVGHVSYGRLRSLGGLRYGARAGIKDFSRKDTDDFGVTTFVRRANSKYLTGTLEVEKAAINQVHNLLTSLTATPVVWIGSDDVYYSDTLLVFGFFRDFYASIDYPMLSIYSLEIEGLI